MPPPASFPLTRFHPTGHFGPITAVDISPDGLAFVSGSFDGYVRLHIFDEDYLFMKDEVPEEF